MSLIFAPCILGVTGEQLAWQAHVPDVDRRTFRVESRAIMRTVYAHVASIACTCAYENFSTRDHHTALYIQHKKWVGRNKTNQLTRFGPVGSTLNSRYIEIIVVSGHQAEIRIGT